MRSAEPSPTLDWITQTSWTDEALDPLPVSFGSSSATLFILAAAEEESVAHAVAFPVGRLEPTELEIIDDDLAGAVAVDQVNLADTGLRYGPFNSVRGHIESPPRRRRRRVPPKERRRRRMGYRRMDTQDLWEIYRRWVAGQTIWHMATAEQRDRKTVREHIAAMETVGLTPDEEPISREEFGRRTARLLPQKSERGAPMREMLEPQLEELQQLIGRSEDPLVAKNAFLVVRQKYDLQVSYETFKRFARDHRLGRRPQGQIIRIELPPGLETRLDYGKVGHMAVPLEQRNRVVWAFCGMLSSGRLPFVQFVFSQDQSSFTGSFVDMVEFYDGGHRAHLDRQPEGRGGQARLVGSEDQSGVRRRGGV